MFGGTSLDICSFFRPVYPYGFKWCKRKWSLRLQATHGTIDVLDDALTALEIQGHPVGVTDSARFNDLRELHLKDKRWSQVSVGDLARAWLKK